IFTIPNQEGWAFFDPDGKGSNIVKSGKSKIESYFITLDQYNQSVPRSEIEFHNLYEVLKNREVNSSRYKVRKIKDGIVKSGSSYLVNFYYFFEDYGAIQIPEDSNYKKKGVKYHIDVLQIIT
ncbi:MAG: hypothetical protein GY770_30360, partial [Aestuariibacter sp.]|nr:hypothetical protein [Aestuariibacter sp.]